MMLCQRLRGIWHVFGVSMLQLPVFSFSFPLLSICIGPPFCGGYIQKLIARISISYYKALNLKQEQEMAYNHLILPSYVGHYFSQYTDVLCTLYEHGAKRNGSLVHFRNCCVASVQPHDQAKGGTCTLYVIRVICHVYLLLGSKCIVGVYYL